jgi:flagellar motor component MotA
MQKYYGEKVTTEFGKEMFVERIELMNQLAIIVRKFSDSENFAQAFAEFETGAEKADDKLLLFGIRQLIANPREYDPIQEAKALSAANAVNDVMNVFCTNSETSDKERAFLEMTCDGFKYALQGLHPRLVVERLESCYFCFYDSPMEIPQDVETLLDTIVEIGTIARAKGLLALEDKATEIKCPFLLYAVMLVVDANASEEVQYILETIIKNEKICGRSEKDVFPLHMITEGLLLVACGTNPRLLRPYLEDMFGCFYKQPEQWEFSTEYNKKLIDKICSFATIARNFGIIEYESEANTVDDILHQATMLIVFGNDSDEVKKLLNTKIETVKLRTRNKEELCPLQAVLDGAVMIAQKESPAKIRSNLEIAYLCEPNSSWETTEYAVTKLCEFATAIHDAGLFVYTPESDKCKLWEQTVEMIIDTDVCAFEGILKRLEVRIDNEILCGRSEAEFLPLCIITMGASLVVSGVEVAEIHQGLNEAIESET